MPNRPSFWFRAAAFIAALFVLTIFIMIAGLFSDPDLPINHWLNRHGMALLLGEVALLLVVGFLAMLTDRSAAAQHNDEQQIANPASQSDEPP
jgi:hypothetical protein